MSAVGEKFKNNEVFVPEVLVAARAMNMGTQILKPLLARQFFISMAFSSAGQDSICTAASAALAASDVYLSAPI